MSEEKKGFTVADRRRFTSDGDLREADAPRPREREQPATTARPAAEPARDLRSDPGEMDFAGFLISLATQASMLLGLAPPGTEAPPPDLDGARQIISILEMLQDKTEGKRTDDEERILEGALFELRMAYVAKTRAGGA